MKQIGGDCVYLDVERTRTTNQEKGKAMKIAFGLLAQSLALGILAATMMEPWFLLPQLISLAGGSLIMIIEIGDEIK